MAPTGSHLYASQAPFQRASACRMPNEALPSPYQSALTVIAVIGRQAPYSRQPFPTAVSDRARSSQLGAPFKYVRRATAQAGPMPTCAVTVASCHNASLWFQDARSSGNPSQLR